MNETQLINELLDVSRIISGKLVLQTSVVQLSQVIETAAESLRPVFQEKEIQFELHLDKSVPPVAADPVRLQQVISNLLSNAMKFTPAHGKVEVRLAQTADGARISVRDSGEGIEPSFLPHVFDAFRQADSSRARKHQGLGLGLAIARQLIELHRGTIRAESAGKGQGALFEIALPVLANGSAIRDSQSGEAPHVECLSLDDPNQLKGLRILVVDDDRDTRETVSLVLRRCGAEVATAPSAALAMEELRSFMPHILLSDLSMPGEDGYALLRKLREMDAERGKHTVAVALTAYAHSEDRRSALSAGFEMHISKPIAPMELIRTLMDLRKRQTERPKKKSKSSDNSV
jgi:CheY-like chemotaxis protein